MSKRSRKRKKSKAQRRRSSTGTGGAHASGGGGKSAGPMLGKAWQSYSAGEPEAAAKQVVRARENTAPLNVEQTLVARAIAMGLLEQTSPTSARWAGRMNLAKSAIPDEDPRAFLALELRERWRRGQDCTPLLEDLPEREAAILRLGLELLALPPSERDPTELRRRAKALAAGDDELQALLPDLFRFAALFGHERKGQLKPALAKHLAHHSGLRLALCFLGRLPQKLEETPRTDWTTPRGRALEHLARAFGGAYVFSAPRLVEALGPLADQYRDTLRGHRATRGTRPLLEALRAGDMDALWEAVERNSAEELPRRQLLDALSLCLAGANRAMAEGDVPRTLVHAQLGWQVLEFAEQDLPRRHLEELDDELVSCVERCQLMMGSPDREEEAAAELYDNEVARLIANPEDRTARDRALHLAALIDPEFSRMAVDQMLPQHLLLEHGERVDPERACLILMADPPTKDQGVRIAARYDEPDRTAVLLCAAERESTLVSQARKALTVPERATGVLRALSLRIRREQQGVAAERAAFERFGVRAAVLTPDDPVEQIVHAKLVDGLIPALAAGAEHSSIDDLCDMLAAVRAADWQQTHQALRGAYRPSLARKLAGRAQPADSTFAHCRLLNATFVAEDEEARKHQLRELRRHIAGTRDPHARAVETWTAITFLQQLFEANPDHHEEIRRWQDTFYRSLEQLDRNAVWGSALQQVLSGGLRRAPLDAYIRTKSFNPTREPGLTALLAATRLDPAAPKTWPQVEKLMKQARSEAKGKPLPALQACLATLEEELAALHRAELYAQSPLLDLMGGERFEFELPRPPSDREAPW